MRHNDKARGFVFRTEIIPYQFSGIIIVIHRHVACADQAGVLLLVDGVVLFRKSGEKGGDDKYQINRYQDYPKISF